MPNRRHLLAVCLQGRGSGAVLPFNTLHMGTRPRHDNQSSKGPASSEFHMGFSPSVRILVGHKHSDKTASTRAVSLVHECSTPSIYISLRNSFPSSRLFFLDHLHEAMASFILTVSKFSLQSTELCPHSSLLSTMRTTESPSCQHHSGDEGCQSSLFLHLSQSPWLRSP